MNTDLTFSIVTTVPQALSIIACLWFFSCYFSLPKKTLGLKLVLILCISDIIFHITMIILLWYSTTTLDDWGLAIVNLALRFSISWASCIAILAYRSLKTEGLANPEQYAKRSLAIALFISLLLSAICEILHHSHVSMVFTLIIPLGLSVTLTAIYYIKAARTLESYPSLLKQQMNQTIRNLYFYSLIQLITVGPTILYYFYDVVDDHLYDPFDAYVCLPLGLCGLVNSVVYFFQRRGTKSGKETESNKASAASSASVSSVKTSLIHDPPAVEH